MPPRRASAGPAALAAALVLLLGAACSDDEPEPRVAEHTEPTSSSEPVTPEPSEPAAPELPRAAMGLNARGAAAFVQHYWDVVNYAQATGDVAPLRSLALPSCERCESGASAIEMVYDRGGEIRGGDYRTTRALGRLARAGSAKLAQVDAVVASGKQTVRGAGDLDGEFPAGSTDYQFVLAQDDGTWLVTEFEARS